jgi:signal transduction histidine kinase
MKILLTVILFFYIQLQLFAQNDQTAPGYNPHLADSLRLIIDRTDNDSTKAVNMILLSWAIEGVRADSALIIAKQAFNFSKRNKYKILHVSALRAVGYNQRSMGDYAESLKSFLHALEILGYPSVENSNNIPVSDGSDFGKESLFEYAEVQRFMGHLLGAVGNTKEQMIKYTIALRIHEAMKQERLIANTSFNKAEAYLATNNLDSAILLAESSLGYYEKQNVPFYVKTYLGVIYNIIGEGNFLLNKYQLAEEAFLKAEKANTQYKNLRTLIQTQLFLSKLYYEKREYESSLIYAKKAQVAAMEVGLKSSIAKSYAALAKSYQALNRQDSGYYYLKLASPLLDSLNKVDKSNLIRFQNLLFADNQNLQRKEQEKTAVQNRNRIILLLGTLAFILFIAGLLYRSSREKNKANKVLESTLTNLKSTQTQLIQAEKMASLGELTAGIAHEIQNPLNFVNNFSEVSNELIDEMKDELQKGNREDAFLIADDIKQNLEKINHHGNRAADIVKGMLQHSRSSSGVKEPTDINALCDEYVRLSYHGLRAKDKSFNATIKTDFDVNIGNINIIPQDIGRVILNLLNNAFYAASMPSKGGFSDSDSNKTPTVCVSTKKDGDKVLISVRDNGPGIPQKVLDKIFQPFFTTKPTGQGTGLGLSLSYDIVKAHGGELKVETPSAEAAAQAGKENEGTEFIIQLPVR